MKKRPIYRAKGKFSSKAKATSVTSAGKVYQLPRGNKALREKIIRRAEKRALKPSFSDKIKAQGLRSATSRPTQARYFSKSKTLNIPGSLSKTFDIVKWTYELNRSIKITPRTAEKMIRRLKRNSYPKFLKTWRDNKGANFLFRIDTAYYDKTGDFVKTDGVFKKDKDGLSDGRGFSIGRYLEIETKKSFLNYLNMTFAHFLKSLETYLARKGIRAGQINALTLEVS